MKIKLENSMKEVTDLATHITKGEKHSILLFLHLCVLL